MVERMERYGNGELDPEFRQISITADDVRSGRLTTHDVNFARYREECLREGIDPHTAVEVEALRPGLQRQRLDETIESLVDDVRQWTSSSERKVPNGSGWAGARVPAAVGGREEGRSALARVCPPLRLRP
ncbi:hypothetical protein [Streptomyces roseochromogenus]|uniref:Uncharacterized protein n=1 Tax=Streptomyces roseochromogenus subsp. oscitans DS 12.976 TaxID=1352936 RepID=V6JID1_STRRC|nr:hypothetical protein [Streptomyces roseochromogenus]EST18896.1 hypothetical protein M878_44070 [Streptomyces roseochromogenus subsp. oscitans DS 12.976]